jgi:heme/copper-type cytochrome/quinol oxidase subunit 4
MKKIYGIFLIIMAVIGAIYGTRYFDNNFIPKSNNEFIFNVIIIIIIVIGLELIMENENTDGKL